MGSCLCMINPCGYALGLIIYHIKHERVYVSYSIIDIPCHGVYLTGSGGFPHEGPMEQQSTSRGGVRIFLVIIIIDIRAALIPLYDYFSPHNQSVSVSVSISL